MLRVHRLHDPQGMGRTVEEVWITERNVLRSGRDLLPDVGEDHLARHDPEAPVVHRDDGAVPAQVLAAPARLREPDDPLLAARQLEPGVLVERGQAAPVRNEEADLVEVDGRRGSVARFGLDGRSRGAVAVVRAAVPAFTGKGDEGGLDLSAQHRLRSELAEVRLVDGGVEPEHGEPRAGRELAEPAEGGGGDPARGVHREMDRDKARVEERLRVEPFTREVDAAHLEARVAKPRCRLGEPERLAPELVGVDEHDRESRIRADSRAPEPLPPRGTLAAQRLAGIRISSCCSRCSSMADPTSTRAPTPRGTSRGRPSTAGTRSFRVFFYHDGANNGNRLAVPPQDERNVGARWSRLAQERGLDLVVCVAAGQRRGILDAAERDRHGKDADVLAPGFRIAGLGLLAEAAILADRFVTFGG